MDARLTINRANRFFQTPDPSSLVFAECVLDQGVPAQGSRQLPSVFECHVRSLRQKRQHWVQRIAQEHHSVVVPMSRQTIAGQTPFGRGRSGFNDVRNAAAEIAESLNQFRSQICGGRQRTLQNAIVCYQNRVEFRPFSEPIRHDMPARPHCQADDVGSLIRVHFVPSDQTPPSDVTWQGLIFGRIQRRPCFRAPSLRSDDCRDSANPKFGVECSFIEVEGPAVEFASEFEFDTLFLRGIDQDPLQIRAMRQQVRRPCSPDVTVKLKTKDDLSGFEVAYFHRRCGSADFSHCTAKADAIKRGHSIRSELNARPFGRRSGFPFDHDDLQTDSG